MTHITRTQAPAGSTPHVVPDTKESGWVSVDPTWGTLQPMQIADGVRTVGELEVIDHLDAGRPVVDSRTPGPNAVESLPDARSIPHDQAADRAGELEPGTPTILFCNGPQCGQSPLAIRALLAAGHPPELIWYYRGGLHDWMTLGLPTRPSDDGMA